MLIDLEATGDYAEAVGSGNVLVYVWATWCQPCKMMKPIMEQLGSELENVDILKVDADENASLVSELGIVSIPTFLVYREGQIVNTITGAKPKPFWLKELAEFI